MEVEYEYGVKLPGGLLSVTPQAHEYYGLQPVVDVVSGGLPRKEYKDQRNPVAHAVIAAPDELCLEDLPHEKTNYARRIGSVMLWVTHSERPAEYARDAFAKSAAACKQVDATLEGMGDEEVISRVLGYDEMLAVRASLPSRQLGDMTNSLEDYMFNQVMYMRETSYPMTDKRREMLRSSSERVNVQTRDPSLGFVHELVTTKAVYDYALRRTYAFSEALFNVYFNGNFADMRTLKTYRADLR